MNSSLVYLAYAFNLLRLAVFSAGALVAIAALLSWAVRTRKISPFSSTARFVRRIDAPLFGPMERRVVRAGGLPSSAPWWTLALVVVGGLVLLSVFEFIISQIFLVTNSVRGQGMPIAAIIVSWTFSFLRIAIIARVISSWVGGGPYSKWWRWSYITTDWFLEPLRRVLPTLGPIDISPLVAYFALGLIQNVIMKAIV